MKIWSVNPSAPDKYSSSSSNIFRIFTSKGYMTRDEYVDYLKLVGVSEIDAKQLFRDARFNAIQSNYQVLQTLQSSLIAHPRTSGAGFGFSLPTMTTYFDKINSNAVRQVLGGPAYQNWLSVSRMFHSGDMKGRKLFSLDTETFGDVQRGRNPFAVTEIGIGEAQFKGKLNFDKYLGNESGYGSFVIGLDKEQYEFGKKILAKMESSELGFDALDREEQIVARRLSMYSPSDAFKKISGVFFDSDPNKEYYVVNHLSNEAITARNVSEGLERLALLYKAQKDADNNPIRGIIKFLLSDDFQTNKNLIYGATSEFDINTIMTLMMSGKYGTYSDDEIAKINALRNFVLDDTHILQAAGALHDMDVASFQKEVLNLGYAGASMAEQLPNFYFKGTQQHEAFWDGFTEGKTLVNHATEVFDNFLRTTKNPEVINIQQTLKDSVITPDQMLNARFFIRHGALDYRDANEFGVNRYYMPDGSSVERAIPSVSLAGQWWQIDPTRTGPQTYVDGTDTKKAYVLSFINSADAMHDYDTATRAVLVYDSQAELDRRLTEIFKNSEIFLAEPGSPGDLEQRIINAQVNRYIDISRREMDKLLSPSSVTVGSSKTRLDTGGGFSQLKKTMSLIDRIKALPDFKTRYPFLSSGLDKDLNYADSTNPNHLINFFSRETAMELEAAIAEVTKASRSEYGELNNTVIRNSYQMESYLGIINKLNMEKEVHEFLINRIDNAFKGVAPSVQVEVLQTAAYRDAYNLLVQQPEPSLESVASNLYSNRLISDIDRYGVDILGGAGDEFYRINFSGGVNTASRDIKRVLSTIGTQEELYRLIGDPDIKFGDDALPHKISGSKSLLGRGLIDEAQARSIIEHFNDLNRNDYMLSQEIAQAISTYADFDIHPSDYVTATENFKNYPRIFRSLGQNADGFMGKAVGGSDKDIDLNLLYDDEILSKIDRIINRMRSSNFEEIQSTIFETKMKDGVREIVDSKGADIVDEILQYMNINEDVNGPNHLTLARMFDSSKPYSVGNYQKEGLQVFLIKPTDYNPLEYQGNDAFLLMTNLEHSAKVIDFITSEENAEYLSSYSKLRNSELSQHAIIHHLPHSNKRYVDEFGNAIVSVNQSPTYERILLSGLSLWEDKTINPSRDGKPKTSIYLNDADFELVSLFSKTGKATAKLALEGDFLRGNRLAHKPFDELMKQSTGFVSTYGLPYKPHFIVNDIMHAYEYRIIDALETIFNRAALTNSAEGFENPARQLVIDFMALQRGMTPRQLYSSKGVTYNSIDRALNSDAWKEYFRRHFVSSPVANEPWDISGPLQGNRPIKWSKLLEDSSVLYGGAYHNNSNYNYAKDTIYDIVRRMMLDPESWGVTDPKDYLVQIDSARRAFDSLPVTAEVISFLGSKSQVEHGSVFFGKKDVGGKTEFFRRTFADYNAFSGMYNLMRPLYTQQGSPMVYTEDMVGIALPSTGVDSLELLRHSVNINGEDISIVPASFSDTAIEVVEQETKEAFAAYNDTGLQEHEFILRTKSISDLELTEKLRLLTSDEARDRILSNYKSRSILTGFDPKDISDETYNLIAEQVRRDFGSVYQDKGLLSPVIKYQTLFQQKDSASFKMDWSRVNVDRTVQDLIKIGSTSLDADGNVVIRHGDIIGRRLNDVNIIHNGADIFIPKDQFLDFIKSSETKMPYKIRVATAGDIADDKIVIFGLEKATSHSIDVKAIANILRNSSEATLFDNDEAIQEAALRIAHYMYEDIADGAAFTLNAGYAKHGGIAALEGEWNTIRGQYLNAGALQELVDIINTNEDLKPYIEPLIDGGKKAFYIDPKSGRMISSFSQIEKQAEFMQKLYGVLQKETSEPARRSLAVIQYNRAHNLIDAIGHRQIMNDHMGTSMLIDLREQQAIGIRGMTRAEGLNPNSDRWMTLFKQYAYNYDGSYTYDSSISDLDDMAFRRASDNYSLALNYDRTIYNAHQQDAKRTLKGMVESYEYFRDPSRIKIIEGDSVLEKDLAIKNKNIVSVHINDILNIDGNRVQTGIEVDKATLDENIFFIDGKPSKFLLRQAQAQGITEKNLIDGSYSIFIDMTGYRPIVNNIEHKGFLVPIQNVSHIEGDRTLFRQSPTDFAGFIRELDDIIKTTRNTGTGNEVGKKLGEAYAKYMNEKIIPQTNIVKKDSDMYKVMQQFVAPNSAEILAQDEAAPLLQNWADSRYQRDGMTVLDLIKQKQAMELDLLNNADTAAYDIAKMDQYREIIDKISSISKEMADDVRTNNGLAREILSLGQTDAMKAAGNVVGKDGKVYNGLVTTLSEEGLKALGLDFGELSSDILRAYQTAPSTHMGSHLELAYLEGLDKLEPEIIRALSNLTGSSGSLKATLEQEALELLQSQTGVSLETAQKYLPEFSSVGTITEDVSAYIKAVQKQARSIDVMDMHTINVPFSTREMNKAIEEGLYNKYNKLMSKTGLGQVFMERVGTFAEYGRFPIFESQPLVKILLDRTMEGKQVRISNPILSSVSHVDFDGDKIFLALMLNGSSVLSRTSEGYQLASRIYRDLAVNYVPDLLAEVIESGDAFKTENPNDWLNQLGSLYQIVDDEHFEEDAIKYARRTLSQYASSSDDEIRAALHGNLGKDKAFSTFLMHSKEIVEGFSKNVGDITRYEAAEMAGITARYRMKSIGAISTPAFRLRETLFTTLKSNDGLTDTDKKLLSNLLIDLSNMNSKAGGLLSYAEQGAIDTKWIKDTNIISKIQDFSRYTYQLLRPLKSDDTYIAQSRAKALAGMVSALGSNVIDTGDLSAADFVNKYITIDTDKLIEIINDVKSSGKSAKSLELALGLNRLHKAVTEIPQVSEIFSNLIGAQTLEALQPWIDKYEHLSDMQKRAIIANRMNTVASPELEEVLHAESSKKYPYVKGQVISIQGDNTSGYEDGLFWVSNIIEDNDTNDVFIETKRVSQAPSDPDIGPVLSIYNDAERITTPSPQDPVLIKEYSISQELRDSVANELEETRLTRLLDTMTNGDLDHFRGIQGIIDFDTSNIEDADLKQMIEQLIGTTPDDISRTALSTRLAFDTYSFTMSQRGLDAINAMNGLDNTSASLLRQINSNIAKGIKQDYLDNGRVTRPLDSFYAEEISKHLGMSQKEFSEQLLRTHQWQTDTEGVSFIPFSFDKYSRRLDFLQKNVYDIVGGVKQVTNALDNLEVASTKVDPDLDGITVVRKILSQRDEKISAAYNDLISKNYHKIVATTQNEIYDQIVLSVSNAPGSTFEGVATSVFNLNASNKEDSIVGFGTYLGKSFKTLNAEDVIAIRKESEWLKNNVLGDGVSGYHTNDLRFLIDKTLKNLDEFNPTATKSAFDSSVATLASTQTQTARNADGFEVIRRQILATQDQVNKGKGRPSTPSRPIGAPPPYGGDGGGISEPFVPRLKRETLSGDLFEHAKNTASKLTAQQVGAGLAALAGLGLVNKLLHDDDRRSPLEAGRSGANQPPVINGQQISGGGAPSTPGFGRTIYHDKASGLDFRVSARTKQRISTLSDAKAIGLAGGGNAQIYAFNDTRGVSDNWLANKFAELSE